MNDAKIAQLKLEDGTSLNVLIWVMEPDISIWDMKLVKSCTMKPWITPFQYFYIDEDYEELGNAGNFLWTFSNWETRR